MAFMDFFSQQPKQANNQQQQQQQQQPQNNQAQNNQQQQQIQQNQPGGGQGNGNGATLPNMNNNQPGGGNFQNTQNQPQANPLDSYSKMFDNVNTDGDNAPAFSIDPKIMDQVVGSQDFTKGINPEVMQKAMTGDVHSLLEIIQQAGRNSYRAAIEHGGLLTDKFVGIREAHNAKGLGGRVRQELTNNALSSTPNYQHPIVRRQLTEIASRLQAQNPDASPEEIANSAKQYLQDLVSAINPTKDSKDSQDPSKTQERGQEYWDKFFDEDGHN